MKLKYNFAIQEVTDFWAAVPVGKDARRYRGVMSLNESAKDMMEFLREDITEEQTDYIIKSVREVVEYLRGFSPIWRDLTAGKKEFIL